MALPDRPLKEWWDLYLKDPAKAMEIMDESRKAYEEIPVPDGNQVRPSHL